MHLKTVFILFGLFGLALCVPKPVKSNVKSLRPIHQHKSLMTIKTNAKQKFSPCKSCLTVADQALNYLLNYILQVGVVGSCAEICSYAQKKTGSEVVGVVCNLLCDAVGISVFVEIIEDADLDSIYYCELLKACPINDHGDAKITRFTISPQSGPQGNFDAEVEYTSLNGTGTGQMVLRIVTVDQLSVVGTFVNLAQQPGNYRAIISINASPDPDCDPTQTPCETWVPGVYDVYLLICNGECGSAHPHSTIYDEGVGNFTITN